MLTCVFSNGVLPINALDLGIQLCKYIFDCITVHSVRFTKQFAQSRYEDCLQPDYRRNVTPIWTYTLTNFYFDCCQWQFAFICIVTYLAPIQTFITGLHLQMSHFINKCRMNLTHDYWGGPSLCICLRITETRHTSSWWPIKKERKESFFMRVERHLLRSRLCCSLYIKYNLWHWKVKEERNTYPCMKLRSQLNTWMGSL